MYAKHKVYDNVAWFLMAKRWVEEKWACEVGYYQFIPVIRTQRLECWYKRTTIIIGICVIIGKY